MQGWETRNEWGWERRPWRRPGDGVVLKGGRWRLKNDCEGPESLIEQWACLGWWGLYF